MVELIAYFVKLGNGILGFLAATLILLLLGAGIAAIEAITGGVI